ncbi:hypothetical protein [Paraburkholderia sacchari]|uniref:hypothetical protein n=1 Tax=Paraburkholderia sacchari TaxID=159450 RepID=UPI00054394CE|nr:hypothetical protein [Paraburkholderia sacchari]NLP60857.1 hypothetical protein [Paraburkholderia sacchari]
MKVFYIASNPDGAAELALEREITELERRAAYASGEPINFRFLPSLPIEKLPLELLSHRPDVVHFSAHAEDGELLFSNEKGNPVNITGTILKTFFNYERRPQLVYFNACNSHALAKAVVEVVPAAIGTTTLVSNGAARASAIAFYHRILYGGTVRDAFEVSRGMLDTLEGNTGSSIIETATGYNPGAHRLHSIPRIIAHGKSGALRFTKAGFVTVEVTLIGCPPNTSQVIFFTDDMEFARGTPRNHEAEAEYLARNLCRVVRETPRRGRIESDVVWETCEDFRIYACGTTAGGETFTVASTVCDALRDYGEYVRGYPQDSPEMKNIADTVARLLDPDRLSEPLRQVQGHSKTESNSGDAPASTGRSKKNRT